MFLCVCENTYPRFVILNGVKDLFADCAGRRSMANNRCFTAFSMTKGFFCKHVMGKLPRMTIYLSIFKQPLNLLQLHLIWDDQARQFWCGCFSTRQKQLPRSILF